MRHKQQHIIQDLLVLPLHPSPLLAFPRPGLLQGLRVMGLPREQGVRG
jgi:hypothetical protein